MSFSSAATSFASKCLKAIKDHPIIAAATIISILAIAGFLTAGLIVPFIVGVYGIIAGLVVGGVTCGALLTLSKANSSDYDDEGNAIPDRVNPFGMGFAAGAFIGAIVSICAPVVGLVSLALVVGATVFGITAGIMVGIKSLLNKNNPPAETENTPSSMTHTTCHTTFGSKPANKIRRESAPAPQSTQTASNSNAVVVSNSTTSTPATKPTRTNLSRSSY